MQLVLQEIRHRWITSLLVVFLVTLIVGIVAYFAVNRAGFQKEVFRNARDIGSNVVLLPVQLDLLEYHRQGGYAEQTMPFEVVDQLLEYRASLNHLIPMLERRAMVQFDGRQVQARIVGIHASIPVPGRPKAPMQRAIKYDRVQLGGALADQLGMDRDSIAPIQILGQEIQVDRVNRTLGSWQDSAVLMDLRRAQELFNLPGQISRIEAIECTDEECRRTGLDSDTVLVNELARISGQVQLLRREQLAEARADIRNASRENLVRLQNLLWIVLAGCMISLGALNAFQRRSEIGVLQALGYRNWQIASLFIGRSAVLAGCGTVFGVITGALIARNGIQRLFHSTGKNFQIDWMNVAYVGIIAILIAVLAACIPAVLSASRNPARLLTREV